MNEIVLYVCNNKDCGHITTDSRQKDDVCRVCGQPGVGFVDYKQTDLEKAAVRVYKVDRPKRPIIKNPELRKVLNAVALVSYDHIPQSIYDAQHSLAVFLDALTKYVPDLPSRLGKFTLKRLNSRDLLSVVFEISIGKNTIAGIIDEGSTEVKMFTTDRLNPVVQMSIDDWVKRITEIDTDDAKLSNFF